MILESALPPPLWITVLCQPNMLEAKGGGIESENTSSLKITQLSPGPAYGRTGERKDPTAISGSLTRHTGR